MVVSPHVFIQWPFSKHHRESALDVVCRYYENRSHVACELVQTFRNEGRSTRIKFVSDGKGTMMWRVLQPLAEEGNLTFIDRNYMYMLNSSKKEVDRIGSPLRGALPASKVRDLIQANYRLTELPAATVAGRTAHNIRAIPVEPDLPIKTMWIDSKLYILLKVESSLGNKPFGSTRDTISVRPLSRPVIQIPFDDEDGFKVTHGWGPRAITRLDATVDSQVGFPARIPRDLDMGFSLEAAFLNATESEPYLQLRYTDGLSMVTLCVGSNQLSREAFPFRRVVSSSGYVVTVAYEGEIPDLVGQKLARNFLARSPGLKSK